MKKNKNSYKKIFSVFLCLTMCLGTESVVYAQEEFESGASETFTFQDNEDMAEEFQDESSNEEVDCFETGESATVFGTGDEESQEDGEIRYIKGRPLTEEEREKELEPFKYLTSMKKMPSIGSDLDVDTYALYPSKYDAREKGFVTSVKYQYRSPMCYAFSMTSIAETSLLAQGKGTYDLSEAHLAYFFGNRSNDPLGNTPNDRNVRANPYSWDGNPRLSTIFLTTRSGLTTEEDVPFPEELKHSGETAVKISADKEYHVAAYLKNAIFSDYSVNRMKQLIMEKQAVEISMNHDEKYYNPDTAAYSDPIKEDLINHAVVVVGWDDTYSRKNFAGSSNVTTDGAWIVKNSWSDNWGDGGYFYISYEDKNISNLITVDVDNSTEYENNYFYDGSTGSANWDMKSGESRAVAFDVKAGNGNAEALGEVNLITFGDNACYSIQIYANLTDRHNPVSGSPVYEVPYEVYQPFAGINTIKIPEIVLQSGSGYSIVVTNTGENSLKLGSEWSSDATWYREEAGIDKGEGFYRASELSKWIESNSACPRIKAHTRTLDYAVTPVLSFTTDKTVLKSGESVKTKAAITPDSMSYIKLRYESSNPEVASVSKNGTIKGKKNGTAIITCKSADSSQLLSTITVRVKALQVSGFRAEPEAYNKITLSWERVDDAKGYVIYRAEEGKKSKKLAEAGAGAVKYKDTSVETGKTYTYTIKAFKIKNGKRVYGKASDKAVAKCTLNTPEFTVKALSDGHNQIKWKKVPGADAYNIFRRKPEGEKWEFLKTAASSETKYNDKKLTPGTAYQYLIQAYTDISGNKVYSRYNISPTIKTAPVVTKIVSTENGIDGICIQWNTQKSCDGYQILRKTKNGSWEQLIKINDKKVNSWIDEDVEEGGTYYYAVRAFVKQAKGTTYGKYKSSNAIRR